MIQPTEIALPTIVRGYAFDAEFDFAGDDGSPYDLASWVVTATMTSGDPENVVAFAVDVDAEGGSVVVSLTAIETSTMNVNSKTNYQISGIDPNGNGPYCLVNGAVTVQDVS